jgi:membrane protein YqaA with SNARE-associated domain
VSEPPGGRIERWAAHPLGPALLFLFAVLEACLFPAPTEALFLALAVGRPGRSWRLAALATAGGVVGAAAGYAMGAAFFERLGRPVLAWHGLLPRFEALGAAYDRHLFLALATSGYTPIPFMLYTIAGGALAVPLLPFLAGAAAGRALKYAVLAVLTRSLGPHVRRFLERHLRLTLVLLLVLLLAFLALRL